MHIAIIGTGYVGLVTGTCFAEFGIEVVCVDIEKEKIEALRSGKIPIYEPGLGAMIERNVREGRLSFTTDLEEPVQKSLVIFITVGTPSTDDGRTEMRQIQETAEGIAKHMNGYKVIVNKSTAPVGTGEWIQKTIEKKLKRPTKFSVVSNPEFLREGSAIEDFMRPNRVVIGAKDEEAIAIMKDLYNPLYLIETPFVITDIQSAELIKYASNTFLATKISFINEIARLCEEASIDVHTVARGIGLDKRIGNKFLHPGAGFGGSCFPKDVSSLIHFANERGISLEIAEATMRVNRRQRDLMTMKIAEFLDGVRGRTIGILGLAFKPNTSDIREAPSIHIIRSLLEQGASVRAFDPVANEATKAILPDVVYCGDAYDACKGADALVLLTEWNQFRHLDLERVKKLLNQPNVIDLRNVYEPEEMTRRGIRYAGVGR